MKGIIKAVFLLIILSAFSQEEPNGEFCGIKNTAFLAGESITMKVFYNAMGVYVGAGEATFTASLEKIGRAHV